MRRERDFVASIMLYFLSPVASQRSERLNYSDEKRLILILDSQYLFWIRLYWCVLKMKVCINTSL